LIVENENTAPAPKHFVLSQGVLVGAVEGTRKRADAGTQEEDEENPPRVSKRSTTFSEANWFYCQGDGSGDNDANKRRSFAAGGNGADEEDIIGGFLGRLREVPEDLSKLNAQF
jgi:hypothetical protein